MRLMICFILLALCSSCVIVNTPGFNSGYKRLTDEERARVVFADNKVCAATTDNMIYAITGKQLLECLKDNDTSVVYFWSPHCHSQVCIPLSAAQRYCDNKGYKLYVIAEYYDDNVLAAQSSISGPVLGINQKYYGTHYCNSYINRFQNDVLEGVKYNKEDKYGRFYIFEQDKFVATRQDLLQRPEPAVAAQK